MSVQERLALVEAEQPESARRRNGLVLFARRIAELWQRRMPAKPDRTSVRPKQYGTTRCSRLRLVIKSDPCAVRFLRERAAGFAEGMGFAPQEIADIKMAVGEAASNALRHGANREWPKIGAEFRRRGDTLHVAVWDKGRGFDPRSLCTTPDCLATGGRGVFLMKLFMDDVTFRFTTPGTRVEMTKTAHRETGEPSSG